MEQKSVLISIRPKWCRLIIEGRKEYEVRKTKPNIVLPFKCFIYCTSGTGRNTLNIPVSYNQLMQHLHETGSMESLNCPIGNGRVIGEFTCDEILRVNVSGFWDDKGNQLDNRLSKTCLAPQELCDYLDEKTGYAWHISDLTIYEQPVELNEFWLGGKCPYASKEGCKYPYHCIRAGQSERCGETILRAPQSWCYTVAGNEPVGVGLNKTEEKGGQIPGHA